MEIFLIRAAQLILCLAILIILHEGGHFLFAKLFGIRVEKFFLFFDYKFHLFSTYSNWWRKLRGKKPLQKDENGKLPYDGTEYGLGWIPLGGYVKIAGMIDESMDREQMKQPAQPWEFRSKPAWQRLLVMLGGVMVNFLLALLIYSAILFTWGDTYIPIRDMNMGFTFNEKAQTIGFRNGDIPVSADGEAFRDYNSDVLRTISTAHTVNVLRDGKEVSIRMPKGGQSLLEMVQADRPFITPYLPSVIDSVMPGTAAEKIGLTKGDRIIAFNGKPIDSWTDYDVQIRKLSRSLEGATTNDSLRKRTVEITFAKADGSDSALVQKIVLNSELQMGIAKTYALRYYKTVTKEYGLLECIPAGFSHGVNVFSGYVSDLKYLFTKEGAKSVGSFGAIGSMFPTSWDWERFWELTAFISIILAFMNILPIPALDGGHALFLILEIVFRRKFSLKFQERAQMIGMWLLIALMIYAIGNDIFRFLL
ncbi:MAG: RIP metalloprotease RseP [Bacteroidaceae bacterium]|nr:RIP metalloprotease RseP [Bacteroidaceae bacterium]